MNKYILTILFFISTSIAQSLTVDECVRIALENKPSLKRAEQDVAIARLNRASTGALMLPSVNASNSFSETTYGNTSSEASERYSGGLSLSQSLFNFGTKINTLKQSDNTYNTAKQQRRQAKARIILDVHTFYYQYLKNSELFDIAGKDLELSKKQLDLVQNQYNLGAVSKTDFLKASVRYGTAKSSFLSRELSKKNSDNFANSVFSLLILGLFFLVLIIEIFMPLFVFLIAPGFEGDNDKMSLAIILTRITFPFLLFISLASFFSAILNSYNKFAAAAAAPIILNIILILVLIFSKYLGDQLVYYLSYGVSLAGFFQLIFLYKYVSKYYSLNFSFKKSDNILFKSDLKKIIALYH